MNRVITKRYQLIVILALIFGFGLLVWAVKTGRIHLGADTLYGQTVSGYIYDRQGQKLQGVQITNAQTEDSAVSDSNGHYSIGVPAGEVTLKFEKDGQLYSPGFTDVSANHWAAKWIGALKNAGIISGYPDGSFHPTEEMTRAQMAVFLARALARGDQNIPEAYEEVYPDVPRDYWAIKYINYLYYNTSIQGYRDGFHPEEKVTRDQMAVFIIKALNEKPYNRIDPSFSDIPTTHWAYQYIEKAQYLGIVSGYGDGTYRPDLKVTRDQMSVFIARAFQDIPLTEGGYNPKIKHLQAEDGAQLTLDLFMTACGEVGRVSGQIKNSSGDPLGNSRVVVTLEPLVSEEYAATTDEEGKYTIMNIPAGTYAYNILDQSGSVYYSDSISENLVSVDAGSTTELWIGDLSLEDE